MKKFVAFLLCLSILFGSCTSVFAASSVPTEAQAYERMIALKAQYPEGMRWTNSNSYAWKGGVYSVGYGCVGFAFLLSDAAFGDLPARKVSNVSFKDVRVGDILRVNQDTHSVIILEVKNDSVVLAEGNYNSSIHWGRTMSAAQVEAANYMLTRYPSDSSNNSNSSNSSSSNNSNSNNSNNSSESKAPSTPSTPTTPGQGQQFQDVTSSDWFYEAVKDMNNQGLMTGLTGTTFGCAQNLTRAQFSVILYRLAGEPTPTGGKNFSDVKDTAATDWYYDAVCWASSNSVGVITGYDNGKFGPSDPITREQMMLMMYRYARYCNKNTSSKTTLGKFPDAGKVSGFATEAMQWAVATGQISGDNGCLNPQGCTSRAVCATIIQRYLTNCNR